MNLPIVIFSVTLWNGYIQIRNFPLLMIARVLSAKENGEMMV